MENKKTMEYCAPVVKEIELSNEGVICGSGDYSDPNQAGKIMEDNSNYNYVL